MVYTWLTYRNTTLHAYMIKTKRGVYITGETNIQSRKTAFILFILNALYSSYQSCHALSKFKYLTKLNSNWVIWFFGGSLIEKLIYFFSKSLLSGLQKMLYDLIYRYNLSKLVIQIYYGLVFYLVCVDYTMLLFTI